MEFIPIDQECPSVGTVYVLGLNLVDGRCVLHPVAPKLPTLAEQLPVCSFVAGSP
jgi:hypothetical protein